MIQLLSLEHKLIRFKAPQISPVNKTAFLRARVWPGDVRLPCNALLVFCWASKSGPQGEVFRDLQCLRVFFGSDWSAEGHMTADSSSSCLTGCGSGEVMSSVPELYGKRCRDLSPQLFPWTGICPRGLRELTSLGICETVTATSSLLLLGLVVEGIQSYVVGKSWNSGVFPDVLLISTYSRLHKRRWDNQQPGLWC